ncbi:MAG: DUF2919 domain-containing protein [Enterovibrio sp.]
MANKGFTFEDEESRAQPFPLFWLSSVFIARSWLFLLMAGVSQQQGSRLLEIFYPHKAALYWALALSFPALLLMLLAGNLQRAPKLVQPFWRAGKWLLLASLCADLYLQCAAQASTFWRFHFSTAATFVISAWLLLYLLRSKRIVVLFAKKIEKNDE